MGCAASTSSRISMNSSSASTAGGRGTPLSDPCSALPLHNRARPYKMLISPEAAV
jgi:hypothetical protein